MNSWMQVYLSDERQVRLLHGLGVTNVGLYQVIERSLMSLTAEMVAHSNAEQSTHSAVDATTYTDSAQHTPLPLPLPCKQITIQFKGRLSPHGPGTLLRVDQTTGRSSEQAALTLTHLLYFPSDGLRLVRHLSTDGVVHHTDVLIHVCDGQSPSQRRAEVLERGGDPPRPTG